MKPLVFVIILAICSICSAEVIFQDGFESGDFKATQNGFVWQGQATGEPCISAENAKTGKYSIRFKFSGNPGNLSADAWSEVRFQLGGQYDDIWVKSDVYIPENYYMRTSDVPAVDHNKGPYFLWSNTYQDAYARTHMEHWSDRSGGGDVSYVPKPGGGHVRPGAKFVDINTDLGKWHEWILHVKLASAANNDGVVEIWKNGVQVCAANNHSSYGARGNYLDKGYMMGYSNTGFDEDTYIYMDNVVFATSKIEPGTLPAAMGRIVKVTPSTVGQATAAAFFSAGRASRYSNAAYQIAGRRIARSVAGTIVFSAPVNQ